MWFKYDVFIFLVQYFSEKMSNSEESSDAA